MKILNVTHSINPAAGGTVEFIKQCSLALIENGHHIEVLSLDAEASGFLKDSALTSHCLGPALLKYGYSGRLVPWLRQNESFYDAVIVHGLWQYASLAVWRALRKSPTPYFVFPHGMLDPWFNRNYPLKHLKKIPYWRFLESKVFRDARAILFTCEEERLLARQSFSNYRCNEIVVNFGTRDPDPGCGAAKKKELVAVFVDRFPRIAGKRYLLFLGRIQEKKGCDLLIQAFSEAIRNDPQLFLVMAGPDQTGLRADLEKLALRCGTAEHVVWTGMLSGDAKWGAIAGAEAFILPSHQENFGIAVAEAMAWGVPVLISDKINIWREIRQDRAGIVGSDTIEGVRQILSAWLSLSPAQRQSMGSAARYCFVQRFEIRQVAKGLLDALKTCGVDTRNDTGDCRKAEPCPKLS